MLFPLTALVLGSLGHSPVQGTSTYDPAIQSADIERCLRFLAADELHGRVVGTEEAMQAARFLAQGLERAGVKPAGGGGTFLQDVPLVEVRFEKPPALTLWADAETQLAFRHGIDFDLFGVPPKGRVRVQRITDGAQVPPADAGVALFLDAPMSERRKWLGEGGGRGYALLVSPGSEKPGEHETTPSPSRRVGDAASLAPASLRARGELLEALRSGAIEGLQFEGAPTLAARPAANVLGVLRGVGTPAHPELAQQAIVFSAHYDHILEAHAPGSPGEDVIMNGADDDASGCAAVLELAEALAAEPAPARTLVFLFATGEEYGLLGTDWYIEHPLVPLAHTVCNLNFEMIGRPDPLAGGAGKLWLTGDARSNLGDAFRALGMPVVDDPRPNEHFFERSDNIAFARLGIVAQTLSSFNLHTDYHGPDDELERIDLVHMEAAIRASLAGVRALARGELEPRWKPGGDPSGK